MKQFLLVLLLIISSFSFSQTTIEGTVKNQSGKPVELATVFIKGTLDGTRTDDLGRFQLTTKATGQQQISVKGEEVDEMLFPINLTGEKVAFNPVVVQSKKIEEIVISAGSIAASNDRSVAILNPIDIVTTAGGQGDIAGAIQTLPGVQRNGGDQTGLQVRGGDVSESLFIIDGMVAQNAFGSSVPGVGQRTRFNPFQFKGTSFSTGGYSARYGQALSSVLDLSTNDLPEKSNVNLGANFAGVYVGASKLMEKNSVEFTANYTNLSPFLAIAQPNVNFYKAPQGFGASGRYVSETKNKGIFKMTFSETFNATGIEIKNPANPADKLRFGIKNENSYLNASYKDAVGKHLESFTAFSLSNNTDNVDYGTIALLREDKRIQGRTELIYAPVLRFKMIGGVDLQRFSYTQKFDTLLGQFSEMLSAGYLEMDIIPFRKFAIKPGVRAEYSQLLAKGNISPRLAAAYKLNKASQISMASGVFYQLASSNYLLQSYRPNFQQAMHLMANYQINAKDRIFRVEGYYKSYDQLVRENGVAYTPNQFRFNYGMVDNSGYGYAQGIDVFWRDKKSIQNFDYWISYSYIDTKRLYQNYTTSVTPDYVSDNNLNVVMKYFWMKLQTNFSATYSYASGRRYYDPNNGTFLGNKAPDYHNLALTISYLTTIKKMFTVFYLSVDNITNRKNVLGYRYSTDGLERYEVKPPFYFNIFFGFNMSLTEFKKDEL